MNGSHDKFVIGLCAVAIGGYPHCTTGCTSFLFIAIVFIFQTRDCAWNLHLSGSLADPVIGLGITNTAFYMLDIGEIQSIKPADLPAPRGAALQILRLCTLEDTATEEIAHHLALDPVLSAELLRIVNSTYFGLARKIQSIRHAVNLLGYKTLRNMVLCLAVKDSVQKNTPKEIQLDAFWDDALRRAVSAKLLSRRAGVDADEAFTAGLLQDFGFITLFHLYPARASLWQQCREVDPAQRYLLELAHFETSHCKVCQLLAEAWRFPPGFSSAIAEHHLPNQHRDCPQMSAFAQVLHCADWICSVYSAHDKPFVLAQTREKLRSFFGMEPAAAIQLIETVTSECETAAAALGLKTPADIDFEQMLREANNKLAEVNLNYQSITWELEKTLQQRDQLAAELNRELELAREIQQSLLPAPNTTMVLPVYGVNYPARELSGDFFDYYRISGDKILFCLGDVSGKGANAVLLMAKTSSLYRYLGKRINSLSELMFVINNEIFETSVRGMFVTMVAGIYHELNGTVELINAGHPPVIHCTLQGQTRLIEAGAPPLGILSTCEFVTTEIGINNASLYVFSDGLTEVKNSQGKIDAVTGIKSLIKCIHTHREQPLDRRLRLIVEAIRGEQPHAKDDITLLALDGPSED